ncbi:unnamed protein product [Kuraishia capsulata CBS 1993]|uniref:ADP-ribosylation factor-like protein 3 n=1 Tax=Kuraishia capsulata CBS 1993 TaxID=1382522 RepID=W6MNL3_9ASCO|nr:uncharacterized protein KUCA_T00004241001 [Kuraishia capsulata CBS 1993]CDK28259.1 unnamed protein product [Kuraishia capsulata CBS 1993]
MFHLAKGLYESWNKKGQYSVLILGLDNAGKTTFLEKLKSIYTPNAKTIPINRILPTVGQNVGTIPMDAHTTLKFWDVGGQETLRELWTEYYATAHGIIFVIDSTDKDRLVECQRVLSQVVTNELIEGIPVLMLANKQDIPDKLEVEDIKEIFNVIAEHLSARDSRVLPISAITGDGVKEAIEWLGIRLSRNKTNRPPIYK